MTTASGSYRIPLSAFSLLHDTSTKATSMIRQISSIRTALESFIPFAHQISVY